MKKLLPVCLLFMLFRAYAQENFPVIALNRIEFSNPVRDTTVKDVYALEQKVVVEKFDRQKQKFDKYNVWGFRNKVGESFRLFKGKVFKIMQVDSLVIYQAPDMAIVGELIFNEKKYFFSNGLDNPIYELKYGELKDVFKDSNPDFLKDVNNKLRSKSLWKHTDADYEIVRIFKSNLKTN